MYAGVSVLPTVIIFLFLPAMELFPLPLFPSAVIIHIPLSHALYIALMRAAFMLLSLVPTDIFAIFILYLSLLAIIQLTALNAVAVEPRPIRSRILSIIRLAPGAIPLYFLPERKPFPHAIPQTWVP